MQSTLESLLEKQLSAIDFGDQKSRFDAANEFIALPNFVPEAVVRDFQAALPRLDASVHRNFIPKYKKGGSVSRYDLDQNAPLFGELYRCQNLLAFLQTLAGRELIFCPKNDPHTYALYYYTEPGDHIGYHYDTSYYQGARYTVLVGLVDDSSCRLEYQLYRDDPQRDTETLAVKLEPGMLVFFNGDKLYHRITPLGDNECRIALTMEYLTTVRMNPILRFVSNMKDSIAYFGFKQVFGGQKR